MADGFTPDDKPATSARMAQDVLEFYRALSNAADEPDDTVASDLLTDLMHWADSGDDLDFDVLVDNARFHHDAEIPDR